MEEFERSTRAKVILLSLEGSAAELRPEASGAFWARAEAYLGAIVGQGDRPELLRDVSELDAALGSDSSAAGILLALDPSACRHISRLRLSPAILRAAFLEAADITPTYLSFLQKLREGMDYLLFPDSLSCASVERRLRGKNFALFCRCLPAENLENFFANLQKLGRPEICCSALHLAHGGVEMAIASLSSALARRGCRVRIVASYELGQAAYAIDERVEIQYLSFDRPNRREISQAKEGRRPLLLAKEILKAAGILYRKKKYMRACLRGRADACWILSRKEHVPLLGREDRVKPVGYEESIDSVHSDSSASRRILQLHYDPHRDPKLLRHLERYTKGLDAMVLLTPDFADSIRMRMKASGVGADINITAIANFLPETASQPAAALRAATGLQTDAKAIDGAALLYGRRKQVITAARLEFEKGVDQLLEAWAQSDRAGYKLLIVGEGREKDTLLRQAAALQISDSVEFKAFVPHDALMELMRASSLYVLPSRSEGFGLVLIEAAACGLPLLAFDIPGGPRLLIKDGVNGFLAADIPALARMMSELLYDDTKRQRLAQSALKLAEQYGEAAILPQWMALLPKAGSRPFESGETDHRENRRC